MKFTVDQLRSVMNQPDKIRNMSVIAHVDHGKTTLTDSLLAKAGLITQNQCGTACQTDSLQLEKEMGITIKSTGVSLYYQHQFFNNKNQNQQNEEAVEQMIVNLIDSPGHVDFSSEVTAALRVTDGALVVVDSVEGVCVQTKTVLRQAMQEKVKPVLIINKMDRLILELKNDPETIYQQFKNHIDQVNVIISNYENPEMGDLIIDPVKGNCAFGSGKQCWAFRLDTFARFYAKQFNIQPSQLISKLWGNNFYDEKNKKWVKNEKSDNGELFERGFCKFIVKPIQKIISILQERDLEKAQKFLSQIQLKLNETTLKELQDKQLIKYVMENWLNSGDALLEMIHDHLPSPLQAQKYRTDYLYEGAPDDDFAIAMRNCDQNGPLMIYISKMIPNKDKSKFIAFGRIFSGTVQTGQKVKILGPNYQPNSKTDFFETNVQKTVAMINKNMEFLASIPAGNTVGLIGVDKYIVKTGTITDSLQACCIKNMKFSVAPVVRVAVKPKNAQDYPDLIAGIQKLQKGDQLVQCFIEETGEIIVACCGELHLKICLYDLEKTYTKDLQFIVTDPVVSYRETVTQESDIICLAKSQNKLNRLQMTAEPIAEQLSVQIDDQKIGPQTDVKARNRQLVEEFKWKKDDAERIWCFGPQLSGPNLLVNQTSGLAHLNEIRDSIQSGFQQASQYGVLAEENLRSVRFNIRDALIHTDPSHRGQGQIIPAARRVFYSSQLTAAPTLLEPIFSCDITLPQEVVGGVYNCLNQRRGVILEEEPIEGSPLFLLKAYLPVQESFGFDQLLREITSGQAFPQMQFSHWNEIKGNPLQENTVCSQLVLNIRKRKGLKDVIPNLKDYLDKL